MPKVHKPLARTKQDVPPQMESIQTELDRQLSLILEEDTNPSISYQRLYKNVEFLCRFKLQSKTTIELYKKIGKFEDSLIEEFNNEFQQLNDIEILQNFNKLYGIVENKSKLVERIYLFLDRSYLLYHPSRSTVKEYFLSYLKANLSINVLLDPLFRSIKNYKDDEINNDKLRDLLINTIKILNKYDDEEILDKFALESYMNYIKDKKIEIYQNELIFENCFKFIQQERQFWLDCEKSKEFLVKINSISVDNLLFDENFINSLLNPLFELNKFTELSQYFKFIQAAPILKKDKYLKLFTNDWCQYVTNYIKQQIESNINVIEILIETKKQFNSILSNYFANDTLIEFKTRDAFQSGMESLNNNNNNQLLKYLDNFFKNFPNDNDFNEINIQTLTNIFTIFKSIKSKDSFINQYQKSLSKRLILKTSNLSLEEKFISLLETEIGDDSKPLFSMIKDIKISLSTYQNIINNNDNIEFEPLLLHSQTWPVLKSNCSLPIELSSILSDFQSLYLNDEKNQNKKLSWSPILSYMIINANFKNGVKELHVNNLQGIVLLLFNEYEKLTYNEIKLKTELDSKNLSSILYSLTNGKYKILIKQKEFNNDVYIMNDEFKDKKKIIKIKQIQMKLRNEENGDQELDQLIDEDDDYENNVNYDKDDTIKAFIVRLLKQSKTIKYIFLIENLLKNFNVKENDLKRNIESLIDQEYIKRIDQDVYEYVP